jgi:hypothetical protein
LTAGKDVPYILKPFSPRPGVDLNSESSVSTFSGLDTAALQVLRAKLEAIPDVSSVVIDETVGTILLVCEPQAAPQPILNAANAAAAAVGLDENTARIETVVRTSGVMRHRVRFLSAERCVERDNHVRMKVALEWHGRVCFGEATGESGEFIELRTAALAALSALESVVGDSLGVRVVGVKQVRAFDSELMVVSMHRPGGSPQRLVGAVPGGRDPRASAAVAVLNGLNRTLGNYLNVH